MSDTKTLVRKRVFENDLDAGQEIRRRAKESGIWLDSTYKLYSAVWEGRVGGFTVPAINIRTLTYDIASVIFRLMREMNAGPVILELARSEMGYTAQSIGEYATVVAAAALETGYHGPIFAQWDHLQVNSKKYFSGNREERKTELSDMAALIMNGITMGAHNIDIDASTLVDLNRRGLDAQQKDNCAVTARLIKLIRRHQPKDVMVTIGGEIGEVGKENSTPEELEVFLRGVKRDIGPDVAGLSKVSVQTGTAHGRGGIVDFELLTRLSQKARKLGLAGTVQHGASTLPLENFDRFPATGCVEIHLATEFQNIVIRHLSESLRERMERMSRERYENQIKKTLGPFKQELWDLPHEVKEPVMAELKERFSLLFEKLRVADTRHIIDDLYF